MAGKLRDEIKQQKPFPSIAEEVYLNLLRTADALSRRAAELFKNYNLSPTQYNVLRILRGAGADGLACRELSERMVTRDPDITRLLDRLEARKLVNRTREQKDRRVITARITEDGLTLLQELDPLIIELHQSQLNHMNNEQLQQLNDLLEIARSQIS